MVRAHRGTCAVGFSLSVLALSSRFDGRGLQVRIQSLPALSVLALSSRFDGQANLRRQIAEVDSFSTRSVESF